MKTNDAEQALNQLIGFVELLLASPQEQEAWARLERFPSEEMALQLYDVVPLWLPDLKSSQWIDDVTEASVLALVEKLKAKQVHLFCDGPEVTDAPEWKEVRSLAVTALHRLCDSRP